MSAHRDAIHALMIRHPDRFLFGSDLVTRHGLPREHYVSRYWCERTLWESEWQGRSPIADPDYKAGPGEPTTPLLRGVGLPLELRPFRERTLALLDDPAELDRILADGAERARPVAARTLGDVYDRVGLLRPSGH